MRCKLCFGGAKVVTSPAPIPPLLGYADRLSVAPGETIHFMVSAEVPRYRASLVRLIQGDESPAGPGYREDVVESAIAGEHAGRRQSLVAGSFVRVPAGPALDLPEGFTVQVWLWPTTPNKPGGQALVARWRGLAFGLDEQGRPDLWLAFADGTTERIVDMLLVVPDSADESPVRQRGTPHRPDDDELSGRLSGSTRAGGERQQ